MTAKINGSEDDVEQERLYAVETYMKAYKRRAEDYRRHLIDLRDHAYEGSVERADREATFRQAVELFSPVVHEVLAEFNAVMFISTGSIEWRRVQSDGDGGLVTLWLLSWPMQQAARARKRGQRSQDSELRPPVLRETSEGSIDPIIVRALLPNDNTFGGLHGHLAGGYHTPNSLWPLNVVTREDAERQAVMVWAIAEGELHRCTYDMAHAPTKLLPVIG